MRSDLVLQDVSPSLHAAIGFQGTNVLRRVRRALWFHRRIVIDGAPGSGKIEGRGIRCAATVRRFN
jgi:hypothetical protein